MSHVEARPAPALHLPRGLPGAGKSTLARELAAGGVVHVELDEIRRRVWPDCPPSWDPYTGPGLRVQLACEAEALVHLLAGRDVVLDRTNLDPRSERRMRQLAPHARVVVHDLTGVPLVVCLARDARRPAGVRVGEAGIRALHERWLAPAPEGLPVNRASAPRTQRRTSVRPQSILTKNANPGRAHFMALPTPGVGDVPKNAVVHGACGSWWTGSERSHCGGCCRTFTSITSFERHRKGMRCNPPESVGLVARHKPYGTLWGLPAPVGGYGAVRGSRDAEAA